MKTPRIYLGALALAAAAAATMSIMPTIAAPAAEPAWPEVALPPGAVVFSMGEQVSVDGLPMRIQGFDAATSPRQTAAWLRRHMPRPLMENQVGDKLVLGRASGAYYITVQLAAALTGPGTRGVVAVSDIGTGLALRAASRAAGERVLARWPSGTQVLSALTSTDQRRSASFLTLANRYSEDVNRARVLQLLREDGMALEREALAADAGAETLAKLPPGAAGGRAMYFKGRGREAVAVISRMRDNRVGIVLNTVTTMEAYP